jgi:pimeloyl-ACP methyl ester carboxylesterase
MTVFVLVHSPSVGPATWLPVATRLAERGHRAVVPSLLGVGEGEPPYWQRVVAAVTAGVRGLAEDQPVVLAAHSNAGLFVPVLVAGLTQPVTCCIFADASVPAASGTMPLAGEEFLLFLRGLAGPDGRLPRWSDWWSDADTAALFPDERTRQVVTAEQPALPLRYFLEHVPAPAGWDDRRCAYLMFSPAYEDQASLARARGWPVRTEPGEHLHQVVDPDGVASALTDLAPA